jgi:hypothetical protein
MPPWPAATGRVMLLSAASSNSPLSRLAARGPIFDLNHELRSAIRLPASAENLQEDFPSRLNNALRRRASPAAVGRDRLPVAIVDGFGIADVLVRVFHIVAGRQDPEQIAAGDLLPGSAGRSHEGLVDPADSLPPRPP